MTDTPPTEQQLDEIETRAAHLHEYACQDDGEGDTLAGTDVPLLLAEVRRLCDRAVDTEPPLSPDYEHPACGFHWHGKDGMDIPVRDGEPVCPRCELVRVEKLLAHRERRCEELRAESKRRGRNVLEHSEKIRVLERKVDSIREQLGAEILRAGQAESALADARRIASRLAAHTVGFGDVLDESDRGPWGRAVGADIAELSAAVAPDAASEASSAPLRPVQPSSVSESAQSPAGTPEGAPRDSVTYPPADDRLRHLLAQRINCHVDTWKLAFFIAGCIADDPEFRAELDRSATAHVAGQPCGDRNCRACFTAATGT